MNDLKVFENNEFGELSVLMIENKEYFPATESARMLGYVKPHDAIKKHCRYPVKYGVPHPQNPDKTLEMNFIPEGDLYRLIIKSKLPSAEKFEKWVFDEVLPTIRQTGGYLGVDENDSEADIMAKALLIAQKTIENKDRLIADYKPKAEAHDIFLGMKSCVTMNECAKSVGYGRNKLFAFLRDNHILMKSNLPYQSYIDSDYFRVREVSVVTNNYQEVKSQTLVTTKGVKWIAKQLKDKGLI
jgi:anti-repressor protein